MRKKINSVQFIDSLAEITRHHDREILEKSLLKTLKEYSEQQNFWLYKVCSFEPDITLGLLAYTTNSEIVTMGKIKPARTMPEYVQSTIREVFEDGQITTVDNPIDSKVTQVIYPAFDQNSEIFAILIQSIEDSELVTLENQRLVHSFLRIYTNYLELIEQTKRDRLTGLLNRETLDSEISRILIKNNQSDSPIVPPVSKYENDARVFKGEQRFWLGVLDIDHFKMVNDTYGHVYGDEILILVARLMEESVRDYDLLFRYGGEEFVILLKAYDTNDALAAFERIRKSIANHQYAKIESLTVSIGMVQVVHQPGASDVIAQADEALYYAKNNGRNRVDIYEELRAKGLVEDPNANVEDGDINFF